MKNFLLALVLCCLTFGLRYANFSYHSPFDWDQARDYQAVAQIARGDLVVLGPVAKGEGGFYLGSLYYYLLYPAFTFLQGSLSALPITSIILDSLVPGLIFLLLSRHLSRRVAFATALFWACSTLLIGASRVSWNVALIPLWSVLTLAAFLAPSSHRQLYSLALLTGLSAHIHVSAIPLIPLLMVINFRRFIGSWKHYFVATLIGLLPILPLILFDLTHSFQNLHLFLFQFKSQATAPVQLLPMITMVITKFGKVVSGLLLARFADNFWLGLATLILAGLSLFSRYLHIRLSSQIVLISTILILALHDYGFPEYYFAPSYLALLILFFSQLFTWLPSLGWVFLALVISLNLQVNSVSTPVGFSLGYKQEIIAHLATLPPPRDLHYQFDPGRDGGLLELVEHCGIRFDPSSANRYLLTDNVRYPAYIDGELASDLLQVGNFKLTRYIVQ